MAEIKRSTVGDIKKEKLTPGVVKVSLPTKPSAPVHDINEYHFLIHGEKKIGKTTLAMQEEKVLLLTFDPLQKSLEVMQRHVPDWKHFDAYLKQLESKAANDDFPYRRVVIDGADLWFRHCQNYVCKKLVIDHPSEEEWGKGWDMLKETFINACDRLMALPCGTWFICHSQWREIQTRKKEKVEKLQPVLKASAEEILVGKVDGWFAYVYDGPYRVMVVRGDEVTGAGCRIDGHFLTAKDERQVHEVRMGKSPAEAYERLTTAFMNEQDYATMEEFREKRDAEKKGGAKKSK